jgi:hypothetical protein
MVHGDASLAQNETTVQNASSAQLKPQEQYFNSQNFPGRNIMNEKTQEAPRQSLLSRTGTEPTSMGILPRKGSLEPYQ